MDNTNHTLFYDLLKKVNGPNITVLSYNIRSMRENFEFFMLQFGAQNVLPEIIILTEIWIFENEVDNYKIPGYNTFHNCNQSYRSGGVIVYVVECLVCSESVINAQTADMVQLSINFDKFSLAILAIYRLHSHTIQAFIEEVQNTLNCIKDKNLLLIGDLNICILENTLTNFNYISMLAGFGLESLINTPTRITSGSKTCIDHAFFRSRSSLTCITGTLDIGVTDHLMIFCSIEIPIAVEQKYVKKTLKMIDYKVLVDILSNSDFSTVFNTLDVNVAYNKFSEIVNLAVLQSTTENKCSNRYNKLKPWMNKRLIKRIEKRKLLYKKTLKYPNNQNCKDHYSRFHTRLLTDLKLQKENYYKNLFEINKNNSSAQWKIINDLTGPKKDKSKDITLYSDDDCLNTSSEPHEVSNILNNYYISIVDKLRYSSDTVDQPGDYRKWFPYSCQLNSMFMYPTYAEEINLIVGSLKSKKSPGIDGWSAELIKHICPVISYVLTHIVNLSMQTGVFPDKLKNALVVPIFKKGDPKLPGNYRPISLLPVVAKVVEKVIKKRLLSFYSKGSYLSKNQFGFMEGKSTEDALIKVVSEMQSGLNENKSVAGIFIDITKAFDCVDHNILLTKLWLSGVRGIALKWFESYLSDRQQCIRIGNSVSDQVTIKYGVPQGSVLGPILFLVYINDLCDGKFFGNITAYADDTALTYCVKQGYNVSSQMQEDLNILKYWFDLNYMTLSTKTKYLLFSYRGVIEARSDVYYKCKVCVSREIETVCPNCNLLERCGQIKYLGLIVDENINWKMHINKLKKETLYLIRKFYLLRYLCPLSVLKTIYYALVNSKLQYGVTLWGGTYYSTLKPLVVSQKKFIRLMLFKPSREPSFPLFHQLQILPLRYLYVYHVMKIFYVKSGNVVCNINVYSHRLRNYDITEVPRPYSESYKKSFSYLAPKMWNKIKPDEETTKSLCIFKKYVRKFLFSIENIENWLSLLG